MTNIPAPKKNTGCWVTAGIFILIVIIAKPVLILSMNFFIFLRRLLYAGDVISFEVLWTITGMLAGAILGAWVAKRRYRLADKWVWYPVGGLAFFVLVFLLVNKV